MTDNDESPNETQEGLEALQTAVDAIGERDMKEMLVDGLMGLQSGEIEPMDMTVEGPPDESEHYLDGSELTGEYHVISRDTTRAVLDESPREVAEVRLFATQDLLNDQAAVQRLCERPGVTCDEDALNGCTPITEEVLDDVFAVYEAGLHHVHFFDGDGLGIAARYDGHMQHYWLPTSVYEGLENRLPDEVFNAIV